MERNAFLSQPDVAGFIEWLKRSLPTQVFHLRMANSRFVPGGLDVAVTGLPAVLDHYMWSASWNGADGAEIRSADWPTTRRSLRLLRTWLKQAVSAKNEDAVLAAALQILRWGGVRGAMPFLRRLHAEKRLAAYFENLAPWMALDGEPSQNLKKLKVERFDSGLTKIHALFDHSGSPIYDTRVGAAMAMLYANYREQAKDSTDRVPAVLAFPSGSARGKQIRNPGELNTGLANSPQFFTRAVSDDEWARWQVRLGWILRAVLEQCDWFDNGDAKGQMAERCHAFEACLFTIGYDLRCFNTGPVDTSPEPAADLIAPAETKPSNWVPSGHPFRKVLNLYREYCRQEGYEGKKCADGFQQWLMSAHKYPISTARTYCFPLRQNEFDLFWREEDVLDRIVAGGEPGLYAALGTEDPYVASDEREEVCLVDAWLVGRIASLKPAVRNKLLVDAGFAGTLGAASTLRTVGRQVGIHFGLLDAKGKPTEFYKRFFGGGMDDFEERISKAWPI